MGIKDRASKAAASAMSIAVATGGLSSCDKTIAVDPLPPPLTCSSVESGQTLLAEAVAVDTNTVGVTVRHDGYHSWSVDSLVIVSGGSLEQVSIPTDPSQGYDPITFRLVFDSGATSASFRVFAKATDYQVTCDIVREFTVTRAGVVSSVTAYGFDGLPLPSRHRASIELVSHQGNVATLEARSDYAGEKQVVWTVTDGTVTTDGVNRANWSLPERRGTYQAQVIVDFGDAGFAFDALSVEVL